jgi:hypothetical protein
MNFNIRTRHSLLAFAVVFGVLGTLIIVWSHAANFSTALEAESGTVSNGAQVITDSAASGGKAVQFGSVSPPPGGGGSGSGVLPIPNPLTGNWTAPAGNYTLPTTAVNVSVTATVNLSAATISGSSGYLFNLKPGANLTVVGGTFSGGMTGLVQDSVPDGSIASVTVNNTHLSGVRTVVFAKTQSGPINVFMNSVVATGLGDGVRATANVVDIEGCILTGGGTPPSGNPAGVHMLDDDAGNVAVPGTYMKVFNSTITEFTSPAGSSGGFPQGDSILGETRVDTADIENNTLGHNSDSGGIDSKMHSVTFKNNTVYSDGDRAISSHYGTLTASGNTIYQVAKSLASGAVAHAYQGSGTLVASNDRLILSSGGYLAQADVVPKPGSGPASTYPRVGHLTLTHITDASGHSITGPTVTSPSGGYTPTITVNP